MVVESEKLGVGLCTLAEMLECGTPDWRLLKQKKSLPLV